MSFDSEVAMLKKTRKKRRQKGVIPLCFVQREGVILEVANVQRKNSILGIDYRLHALWKRVIEGGTFIRREREFFVLNRG